MTELGHKSCLWLLFYTLQKYGMENRDAVWDNCHSGAPGDFLERAV